MRGRALLEPGRAALAGLVGGANPPESIGVGLGGQGDATGTVAMDLMAWAGAVSADPAAGSLLGTFAVLPDSSGLLLHTLTASASFVVPSPFAGGPPALQVAWAIADVAAEQAALGRHLADHHPGLLDRIAALPDTHRVVHLMVPAIVARMPLPPRPPLLSEVPGGLAVSGHQGGPIALRRFDRTGEHHDRYLLVPASGEILEPPDRVPPGTVIYEVSAQDPWGQWGGPGSTPPSDKPVPPTAPPTVVLELERTEPSALPEHGPASPGRLVVRAFATTPPTFGVEISSMGAALTGTSALSLALAPDPAFATQPGTEGRWWVARAPILPTRPGESARVRVVVTAQAGSTRLPAEPRQQRVVDARPVAVELTSPVLLFAGAAGPDPTDGRAEADLIVPRPAVPSGTTFRLYSADEAAILGTPGAGPRHARVSALLAAARTADASRFVRLPDDAVRRSPAGELRVRATLPGRSVALRVLRLAAVSAAGIEAPGSRCGAFVVAVPLDDAPGRPTLTLRRAGPRALHVSVTLTHPRPNGEALPSPFDLRGTPPDASVQAEVWWGPDGAESGPDRALRAGVTGLAPGLSTDGTPWHWRGELDLSVPDDAPSWLPIRLWARVAWPSEPAWISGTTPVPGPVRRRWGDVDAQPSRWSDWSHGLSTTVTEAAIDAYLDAGPLSETQLVLPLLAPGAPAWQIVATHPRWGSVRRTSAGGRTDLDLPKVLGAGSDWSITVNSPDGSLGRVVGTAWVPALGLPPDIYDE